MKPHPAAEIFPLMQGADFDALVADIREHGQREPIIVHEGMILDGRNRHRACVTLGIEPEVLDWSGSGTPEAFVVSMNLHRRHLNESQRAMIGARIAAKSRNYHRGDEVQIPTASQAADLVKVHRSTVVAAKQVLKHGDVGEIQAVEAGRASVHSIAEQIRRKVPPEKRASALSKPLSDRGDNPQRIQKQRLEAEVWQRLDAALESLTGLPLPSDVAEIVRKNHSRARSVDDRAARALNWLEEFSNVWNRRSETAA